VLLGHGVHDPVISIDFARRSRERLEAAGVDLRYREWPIGHQIDPGTVREVVAWLGDVLP
jgi:phospholipase/carboxylesterase